MYSLFSETLVGNLGTKRISKRHLPVASAQLPSLPPSGALKDLLH